MTEINEDLLVTLPAQGEAAELEDDVEGHGMREAAIGLGVAAAVLGSAGAAGAMTETSAEGAMRTAGGAVHSTLGGADLRTTDTLSKMAKPTTNRAVDLGREADTRTAETVETGHGAAQAAVDAALAEAEKAKQEVDDTISLSMFILHEQVLNLKQTVLDTEQQLRDHAATLVQVLQDDARTLQTALEQDVADLRIVAEGVVQSLSDTATGIASFAKGVLFEKVGEVNAEVEKQRQFVESEKDRRLTEAQQLAAEKQAYVEREAAALRASVEQKVGETEAAVWQKVDETQQFGAATLATGKGIVNTELNKKVNETRELGHQGEAAKDSTTATGTKAARDGGTAVQSQVDEAVPAVASVPGQGADAATAVIESGTQTWEDASDDLTAPDVQPVVEDASSDIDEVAGSADIAQTVEDVTQDAPQL
jgi:hypothetical protein